MHIVWARFLIVLFIWSGERFDESDVRVAAMQMILIFGFASVMNIGERKRHD